MTIRSIYNTCCNRLLEPGGLQLGLITNQEFLDAAYAVTQDFCQKAGLVKKIATLPLSAGGDPVAIPDWMLDSQEAFADEQALEYGEQGEWDKAIPGWRSQEGYPQMWAQDRTNMKNLVPIPSPVSNGDEVLSTLQPMYGIPSDQVSDAVTLAASAPWLGTVANFSGDVYLETAGPYFGTIANLIEARTNLAVIGTAGAFNASPGLDSPIENVPDSFTPYLAHGVLARLFSKDGEAKDDQRAEYSNRRYEEGLALAKAMTGELAAA